MRTVTRVNSETASFGLYSAHTGPAHCHDRRPTAGEQASSGGGAVVEAEMEEGEHATANDDHTSFLIMLSMVIEMIGCRLSFTNKIGILKLTSRLYSALIALDS